MTTHLFIPDCQVKPGVPLEHLSWIGRLILDERPDVIVNIGDFADMASLSSYDRGKMSFEGRRYNADLAAVREGLELLHGPLNDHNNRQRELKQAQYRPRMILTLGNHEQRIERVVESQAELEGVIGVNDLGYEAFGYEVYPFLQPVEVDGVFYAHYFHNKLSGRPHPNARLMIQREHVSCSQGHVQQLQWDVQFRGDGWPIMGIMAGACYLHDEDYKGVQGNHHWRGVIIKRNVTHGSYSPEFLSLESLRERYG